MKASSLDLLTMKNSLMIFCFAFVLSSCDKTKNNSETPSPATPNFPTSANNNPANPSDVTPQSAPSANPYASSSLPKIDIKSASQGNYLVDTSLADFFGWLPESSDSSTQGSLEQLAKSVRQELHGKGVTPLAAGDFRTHRSEKVTLGKLLFYDRILSGNMTVSCASCHVVWRGTTDGTSLMTTVGYKGLFQNIDQPTNDRLLPRNTPSLFNRGHISFKNLFWDGRVEAQVGFPSGHKSPAGMELPEGLDSALAVQALFPMTSPEEMLGRKSENAIAASFSRPNDIWNALMARVLKNHEYVNLLRSAYPDVTNSSFTIVHVANAIAAFEDVSFKADASPFDQFLAGNDQAISTTALQGAQLFYGRAMCSTCHEGTLQTDQKFHAIGVPQFGIGKGHGINNREDYGRGGVTNLASDRYKFKTPTLRNVFLTGPWGHDGAFADLRAYVRHYGSPAASMKTWNPGQVILRTNIWPQGFFESFSNAQIQQNIINANEFSGVVLSAQDVEWIVEFMGTLTDRTFMTRDVVPQSVPSSMSDFLGIYGLKPEWFNSLRSVSWL